MSKVNPLSCSRNQSENLSFVTWCIILLEVAIEYFFIYYLYRDMHNKSVVAKLAIKLFAFAVPGQDVITTLQYSIKNNTIHTISHHNQINDHIFDFL